MSGRCLFEQATPNDAHMTVQVKYLIGYIYSETDLMKKTQLKHIDFRQYR